MAAGQPFSQGTRAPENGRPFGGPATANDGAVSLDQELVNFAQEIE